MVFKHDCLRYYSGLPQKLGWIVYGFFVCGMIVPTQVNMIPVFVLMNKLGLVNTLTGVIIVSISFLLPIGVFIITGFMKTLPKELFEAAWTERQSGKYIRKSLFDSQYHQWLQ